MFGKKSVLVVENNAFLALDLSQAIEDLDGLVAGPTNRVAHALELLDDGGIAAAIIDCHLAGQDVLRLAGKLAELEVPFIVHFETELPDAMTRLHPEVPVLRKPVQPQSVMECLLTEMGKAAG
jgi:CheY-like chemotaxis protein